MFITYQSVYMINVTSILVQVLIGATPYSKPILTDLRCIYTALGHKELTTNLRLRSRKEVNQKNHFAMSYSACNDVHGANMEPTWVLSAPDGPQVGPTNLAIRGVTTHFLYVEYRNLAKGIHVHTAWPEPYILQTKSTYPPYNRELTDLSPYHL